MPSARLLLNWVNLVLLAFPALAGAAPQAQTGGQVVLTIDGTPIRAGEFASWLLTFQGRALASEYATGTWLIEREALRRGVEITPSALEAHVQAQIDERIRGAFHGEKQEWLEELARTGRTEGGLRRQRALEELPKLQTRALAAQGRVVPEEKLEREWWLRYGRKGIKHELLLMKFGVRVEMPAEVDRDSVRAEDAAAKARRLADAQAVRARLAAGADFGQLAQEHSTDPDTREHRGRPSGGFQHAGWPNSFLDAIEALQVGELSQPLYARGGWWLVQVRGRTETPLTRVREELTRVLIDRGPEDDEQELVRERVRAGVRIEVLPGIDAPTGDAELDSWDVPALAIDGTQVSRATYARWLLGYRGEAYVRSFVEEWLQQRKARELGIVLDEAELQARAREWVGEIIELEFRADRERFLRALAGDGRSEEDFLREAVRRMRVNLLTEKLMLRERVVTEAEVRARFEQEYGQDGVRREVSWIVLFPLPEAGPADETPEARGARDAAAVAEVRKLAGEIVRRARAGEDFAALARKHSQHVPTREHGGRIAGRFRSEPYDPALGQAVAALEVGQVSEPVPWGQALYVLRLDDLKRVTFEAVRAELERELATERPKLIQLLSYRNALANAAKFEIAPDAWR